MTSGVSAPDTGRDAALAAKSDRPGLRARLGRYYSLTKPGVLYGNVLTAAAGFFLASGRGTPTLGLFLALMVGTTLIIASACVLNNVLDRDIDQRMERTSTRATVTGSIPARNAVLFSVVMGLVGLAILVLWTNALVVATGIGGFITYVWLYGALSKRMSLHGTLVGSVSGAAPILAGYLAVSGRVDAGAVLAFAMLFLWQMPEFYSIAIYRREEYARAGVPVISVVKGERTTAVHILAYTVAFVVVTLLLPVFGYVGLVYTIAMAALGGWWIYLGVLGLRSSQPATWARRMFRFSMVMILALCVMVSVGPFLP
ncbi:heme o synthase [Ruania albidiflava]|uniref:heme o synthase n=1 Tax=Ruania albidiflava TaxID=366586 RepID=UPI0003B4E696|nr:heme o synthase [Ruania albidiflava]